MKAAPLALLLVCAPAGADVAVPQPTAKNSWADSCAVRIDDAARKLKLVAGARVSLIPLRRENGAPNPLYYVEYAPSPGSVVTVGDEPEQRPDSGWAANRELNRTLLFRRYNGRFARMFNTDRGALKAALDDCLKMGESK